MAYVDDVADTLSNALNAVFAPLQPNLPPDFVNLAPTAGAIPSTLTAPGHALQYNVMTRIENQQATVVVYDGKIERDMPFLNEADYLPPVNNGDGTFSNVVEVSRSEKEFIIEVLTYNQATRRVLTNQIRLLVGDFLRLTEADGTTTIHRYVRTLKIDTEQRDSLYISQVYLMSDYTVTNFDVSYLVTKPELLVEIENPVGVILTAFQTP